MSAKEELKELASLSINSAMFKKTDDPISKESTEKDTHEDEVEEAVDVVEADTESEPTIVASSQEMSDFYNDAAGLSSDTKEKEESPRELFKKSLSKADLTETDAFDIIMDIANNGYFERRKDAFKGALKFTLRSADLDSASRFMKYIEDAELKSEARASFLLGLYMLASFLHEYNGTVLSGTILEKAEFIKKTIPPVFYKSMKLEASKMSEIVEILGSEVAADFF